MNATRVPLAELTDTAISLLCREIGVVNTARFLNQFTTGFGNYTEERDEIVGHGTVDELVSEIKQRRTNAIARKKPSRGRSRSSRR